MVIKKVIWVMRFIYGFSIDCVKPEIGPDYNHFPDTETKKMIIY